MASEAYELLALLMRYVFVLIGALVLLRAFRWMRRDAKNYRREMRALPDAGLVGQIVDLRNGKSQPLPREGDMGSSHECDIFIKGAGVLRHHARFAFEEGKGVLITPSRHGKTFLAGAELRAPGYALHGTQLQLGEAALRVRLFAGLKVPQPMAYQPDAPLTDAPLPYDTQEEDDASFFGDSFYPGPDIPAPFEFPDQPVTADDSWQQAVSTPQKDYDGHYTDDGQMTWQYAYSMEELYQAQAALNQPPPPIDSEPENDEALPYQSPVARRRRRERR
ncbi:MAG: FHA domain-containing protein [Clostridia bacterium]|nr:FHA domain-containing protein [Clostridia bacterium]